MEDVKNPPNHWLKFSYGKFLPLLLVCLITFLFYPSISLLYSRWVLWDEGLSHGLMIIGMFLFFIVKNSPWIVAPQSKWLDTSFVICLALVSIFWFLAHISSIFILEQLVLIPALFLVVAATFGWQTSYQQKMLLIMPIFAIPVWDILNSPLVNLSSYVVGKLVQLIGMPAVIDGNSIFIPYGHILIADGCSGIRYFVIALALGYIISYLNNYQLTKTVVTLAIAALLGLVANWVRIFLLVVIGYQTEMQSSLMNDHEYFGWLIFALIGFPAIYFAPIVKSINAAPLQQQKHRIGIWIIAIVALAIGPFLNLAFNPTPKIHKLSDILSHSFRPLPSSAMPMAVTSPTPAHRENATDGKFYFQIDQYQRKTTKDKLVPYINRLYNNEHWSIIDTENIHTPDLSAQVTRFRHKSSSKTLIQLQWFALSDTTTPSLTKAKLLQIAAQLRGQNHFVIASIQASCVADDCESVKKELVAQSILLAQHIHLAKHAQGD